MTPALRAREILARTLHATQETGAAEGQMTAELATMLWYSAPEETREAYREAATVVLREIVPLLLA